MPRGDSQSPAAFDRDDVVATGITMRPPVTGSTTRSVARKRETCPSLAVGCDRLPFRAHGKEGSTVRVRQRALQSTGKPEFVVADRLQFVEEWAGMDPFMEPSAKRKRRRGPESQGCTTSQKAGGS
jgi:hypothetical protein